jgi:octaprenyl-diphosphate synthase
LVVCQLLGYSGERDIRYGAVIEMIHTATLIHDDIIDHAKVRRGRPTANNRWGNQLTVLLGDWLYTRSMELALEVGDVDIMRLLSRATIAMIEGEIMGLRVAGRLDLQQDEYLEIIGRKTGELFSATCAIPTLFEPEHEVYREALLAYGYNLGICFQIVDDLLDITGSEQRLGKPVFSDLREGKVTLPFILAWPKLDEKQRRAVARVVSTGELGESAANDLRAMLRRHGALREALAVAGEHGRTAVAALDPLPATREREALNAAPAFLLQREY